MTETAVTEETQDIVVDEVFPHAPEVIWRALTSGELIGRWLMPPSGFEPVEGNCFTFQTKAAGNWDGTIRCQVLKVVPLERFVFSWKGGDAANVGYGSALSTIVTWSLSRADTGTHLRLVHSGFVMPTNGTAFKNMSEGWKKIIPRLGTVVDAPD